MANITNLKTWLVISIFLVVPGLSTPALSSPDTVLSYDDGTFDGIYPMIHQSQYLRQRFLVSDFGLSGDYLVKTVRISWWRHGLEDFTGVIKLRDRGTGNIVPAASFSNPAEGWQDYDVSGSGFVSDDFYVELWQTAGYGYIYADTHEPHHGMSEFSTNSGENWHLSALEMDFMVRALVVPASAVGRTIYVDDDAYGANEGSSWADAYWFLQDALAAAQGGDEIRVAQGIYKPDEDTANPGGTGDQTATFQLKNGVAIYGGFAGGEISRDQRDAVTNVTILSGDLAGNDVPVADPCDLLDEPKRAENSYHVVTGSNTDATAILDDFTITGGNANGSFPDPNSRGGGMYCNVGSPTLSNCTFRGNAADSDGGGLFIRDSSTILTNCTFAENSADHGGGAIQSNFSGLVVNNCVFSSNWSGQGGGIYNHGDPSPIYTKCLFIDNSANFGGAMQNRFSSPTLTNCIFSGNSASEGGVIKEITSNSTLTNCTFVANSAINGRALSCDSYQQLNPSTIQVTNCILWDGGGEIWNDDGSTITITYSDVQGGWPGAGNTNADPLFVDAANGDYHLQAGSPCIDAGDNSAIPAGVIVDLDGNPRIINGIVDMGAYEGGKKVSGVEGFETGDFSKFPWEHYGDEYWAVTSRQKHSGTYSAKARELEHDQSATLQVTLDCVSGNISFYRKVSSELIFDRLKFYIDGAEKGKWSGEEDWAQVSFGVTAGTRTFEWNYSKDSSESEGDDTAWIDDVVFPVN